MVLFRRTLLGLACLFAVPMIGFAAVQADELPLRQSPIPATTNSVPHVQIDIRPNPAFSESLVQRIQAIPGIHVQTTSNSLAGARGFRLGSDMPVQNPQSLLAGREFAHLHRDGSLHVFLPPELAVSAIEKNWGTYHPWAGQNPGWEGFIMIYTPSSQTELETVIELIEASYEFVTGLPSNPNEQY